MSDQEIFSNRRLTVLPKTNFSGIDFNNIIEDITELVTENPEYNENWDDFLSSNAGRMLVELFAYIADQLATRIDWVVNENFIGTATQKKSIVRLLKLIGYNLSLPTPAVVPVTMVFDRPLGENGEILLSYYDYTNGADDLNLYTLTAKGRDGLERKTFEAIPFDETTKKYTYKDLALTLNTGTSTSPNLIHTVNFYEGKTYSETVTVDTNNNFVYELAQTPVIDNSVEVFILNNGEPENLLRVESFLDPRAQRETDISGDSIAIPYVVNVLENDRVTIEFGPISLLPKQSRRPQVGDEIRIFYRVGGGLNGNITRRSINTSKQASFNTLVEGEVRRNTATGKVRFINNAAGTGGAPGESIEYAAAFGPLQIRTAQKAVTAEDYDTLLNSENTILKAKAFGNNNIPPNLYSLYGLYIRPLEVWNYAVVDKPGWEDVPPSRYKDFNWIDLRLENRFNEVHSFVDGFFNQNASLASLNSFVDSSTIEWATGKTVDAKNYVILSSNFSDNGGLYIDREDFKARLTSKIIDDNFFDLTNENNLFSSMYELRSTGTFRNEGDNFQIKQDINAYYVSNQEYIPGSYTGDTLRIGFDNRSPIDLTVPAPALTNLSKEEFIDYVNQQFKESANYNNDNTPTQASIDIVGNSSGSPSTISISATPDGQYDGTALNRFTFEFIDTGTDSLSAEVSGDEVIFNFGGQTEAAPATVATVISSIEGITATVVVDADNFTVADDVTGAPYDGGGTNPVEFTGGIDTIKTKGKQRLGFTFEDSSSRPKKNVDGLTELDGNYFVINNATDSKVYWFWINLNGSSTKPTNTITEDDDSIPESSVIEREVAISYDAATDVLPLATKIAYALADDILTIDSDADTNADFTVTVEDTLIRIVNNTAGFARKPMTTGNFFIVEEITPGLSDGVAANQEITVEVGRTFINSNSRYEYRINGIQYNFKTGTNPLGPTFEEIRTFIEESTKINFKGSFENQSETASITSGNDFIHFIKKGMKVRPVIDETAVFNTGNFINFSNLDDYDDYRIEDVNWRTDEITFIENQVANRTADDYAFSVYPYDVEIIDNPDFAEISIDTISTITDIDGDYIIIKNIEDNKYYYFWFNSTGAIEDPEPLELYLVDPANKTSISIDTSGGAATNEDVAVLLQTSINSITGFDATVSSNVVSFNSTNYGKKEKVTAVDGGFITVTYRYKDIQIINPTEEPVGPVWLQQAQNVVDIVNLFVTINTNMTLEPYMFDRYATLSYGAVGSQYLGLNSVINRTRGFQSFPDTEMSSIPGNITFILTINGTQMVSGGEITVNLADVALETEPNRLDKLIADINTHLQGLTEPTGGFVGDYVEVTKDEEGLVRFTSLIETDSGTTSSVDVADGSVNPISGLLGTPNSAVEGEPDALVVVPVYDTEYSFILNNYQYDILIETGDTMIDLFNKIKSQLDVHGYTTTIEFTGDNSYSDWIEDIYVVNRAKERVRFEDINLFSSLELTKLDLSSYSVSYDNSWTSFDIPIGGGDYSSVTKTFRVTTDIDTRDFFGMFSPSVSESSVIDFYETGAEDGNFTFFGLDIDTGSSVSAYGYNRATIISNTSSQNLGNIIYEIGSLNFRGSTDKNIFYHYVYNENSKVIVGRYNTDNYPTTDPSYREYARRIYNTVYNENTGRVDFNLSNFNVKFTKDSTDQVSLFAIDSDWEVSESTPASISTVELGFKENTPTELLDDHVGASSYLIKINIDNIADVEIDITNDQGSSTGYSIEQLVDNINNAIQSNTNYSNNEDPVYRFFLYASLNETRDRIIISSPINSENSAVIFKEPLNTNVDATGNLFPLNSNIPGYRYETTASGDYYFDMNRFEFQGNFSAGSREIRVPKPGAGLKNVELEDLKERLDSKNTTEQSPEGTFLFLEVVNVAVDSYVTSIEIGDGNDDDKVFISNAAGTSAANQKFYLLDDLLAMFKIPKEEGSSTFPDLDFNFHFINDRRYREGVFDGRVVSVGEGSNRLSITTNGYPLLSLDEDVYDTNLNDKKIVGINHVFKTPKFKTFDISGVVYYRSNYSRIDVQTRVENSLNEYFSLKNRGFGEIVARSTIMNIIHQNDGIEYVEIDYLGPDLTDFGTNVDNIISARFDEIIVLSEFNSVGGVQTSGIKFDYNISGV